MTKKKHTQGALALHWDVLVVGTPRVAVNQIMAAWAVQLFAHGHAKDHVCMGVQVVARVIAELLVQIIVPGVQAVALLVQIIVPGVQAAALRVQKAVLAVPAAELPVQIIVLGVQAVVAAVLRVLVAVPVVTDVPAVVPEAVIADAPANVRAVRATAQALVPQSV